MSEFVSLAANYNSGEYAKFVMETQVLAAKKIMDFNFDIQRELIQQLGQTAQTVQTNNPTNTGTFLDIKA